jgi:hypothetical protein
LCSDRYFEIALTEESFPEKIGSLSSSGFKKSSFGKICQPLPFAAYETPIFKYLHALKAS